jgi:hypothetical protein
MLTPRVLLVACCIGITSEAADAQTPPPGPPVKDLAPPTAGSAVTFRYISQVIALSDGRVLVNDGTGKAVIMLDARLANPRAVLDSTPGRATSYSRTFSGLLPASGDTTVFVDVASTALIFIHPDGSLGRIVAAPPSRGLVSLIGISRPTGGDGTPRVIANHFIYSETNRRLPPPVAPDRAGTTATTTDSASILRANLSTRVVDTLAQLSTGIVAHWAYDAGGAPTFISPSPAAAARAGRGAMVPPSRPFLFQDQWAATPDGWIAVLREQEYRMQWLDPAGKATTSTRLPYPWTRLDDTEKRRLADSVNADSHQREVYQNAPAWRPTRSACRRARFHRSRARTRV